MCFLHQSGHEAGCGQGDDSKHEVAHHFDSSSHSHPAASVAALEQAVDSFDAASLAVADFVRGFKLALFSTPRIVVDDGDMAQLLAK